MGVVWFILALVAAGCAYWLRSNHRWIYGLTEILVGVIILAVKFLVTGPVLLATDGSWSPWYEDLTALIALFSGIYAIVRGLDNFVTGVRE